MIRRAAIALAACAAIFAAGCGGGGSSSDGPASLVPPKARFYLESVVRPEGAQRDAIDSLASRIGGIDDPGGAIVRQLDLALSNAGLDATYEGDIAPWLGQRAAVFVTSFGSNPPFAAMFETTDSGATEDFLKKAAAASTGVQQQTYKGVQYYSAGSGESGPVAVGVVGDFMVGGTLEGFKAAVDASQGDSLADSSGFEDGTSALPDDNLALGYVDGEQAGQALAAEAADPLQATAIQSAVQTLANGAVTFALSATPDTATVDLSLPSGAVARLQGGDLLGKAPGSAWFALGAKDLGGLATEALDTADVLPIPSVEDRLKQFTGVDAKDLASWLEQGYGFVGGTSERTINIGGVVTSSDPGASRKAIAALERRFQQDADARLGPPPKGANDGFSASAPESPQAVQVGQFGDQVVAALGPGRPGEEALHPQSPLADDPTFKDGQDTLGGDFSPLAYVSLPEFFVVAEKGGSANDPDFIAAKPYLDKLDYLMVGTAGDGDRSTARFVVGVQ